VRGSQFGKQDCTKCGERKRDGEDLQMYLCCKNTSKLTWKFRPLSGEHPDTFLPSLELIRKQLTLNGELQNMIKRGRINKCMERLRLAQFHYTLMHLLKLLYSSLDCFGEDGGGAQ
jgi:hypothetical protein